MPFDTLFILVAPKESSLTMPRIFFIIPMGAMNWVQAVRILHILNIIYTMPIH